MNRQPQALKAPLAGVTAIFLVLMASTALAAPDSAASRMILPSAPMEQWPPELAAAGQIDLQALFQAYRGYCQGVEIKNNDRLYLIMRDGTKILYDDGRAKSFEAELDRPDLEDMMHQLYPSGEGGRAPGPEFDPGRVRVRQFFEAIYGATPEQVKANLVSVNFLGKRVQFNTQNGAARALSQVGEELEDLLASKPQLRRFIFPLGGSFNSRAIQGTHRPSPHCWAIAIDLNARRAAYWRWRRTFPEDGPPNFRQDFPAEIVKIFEEHGFIWGGKWSHFDTMHFEYRPELLIKWKLLHRPEKAN